MIKKNQDREASTTPRITTDYQETREDRYVVIRDGHRVSAQDYSSPDDHKAIEEQRFWEKVSKNHSWGEHVGMVKYDNKLHRVW